MWFLVWVKIYLNFYTFNAIIVFFWEKSVWRLWAKALGDKYGLTDKEADVVCAIRTAIVLCYLLTNLVIVLGVIHHW